MRTVKRVFLESKPRAPLCRRLGVSVQYASDIALGRPIGGTETLAKISARLQLTDEEIGASVREMFPKPFADQPDAA